jgi:large subunit ribosomal protein L18
MAVKTNAEARAKRRRRIRGRVVGAPERPRLAVFRSNRAVYAQVIDDVNGVTLAAARSAEVDTKGLDKSAVARKVGELIGQRARAKQIEQVVFDRSGYLYHGRVKALAEGARESGLVF